MSFLETIKPGDQVVVDGGGYSRDQALHTVFRVTSTQIVVNGPRGDDWKFRRQDGYAVGTKHDYRRAHIIEATPELVDILRRRRLTATICRDMDESRHKDETLLPLEVLQQIRTLVP